MKRRAFITAAALAPIAGMAGATISPEDEYRAMARIRKLTGLSLDDIADWFEGLDLERLISNIENAPVAKWNWKDTHTAIQTLYAGSAMTVADGKLPMRHFIASEIRRKGDRSAIARVVAGYRSPPEIVAGLAA